MAHEGAVAAFGEQLRAERESRGLAIEAIYTATKVPIRYIRALEAGSFRELPGGVFRRGFVRSYLGVLGLEESSWMKRFEESCRESGVAEPGDTAWTTFAENVKNGRGVRRRTLGLRWLAVVAFLAILTIAGWCGWRLATHRNLLPMSRLSHNPKSWVDNGTSR